MEKIRLAACEQSFPCWGRLAMQLAHDAGFEGIQITDGGGYLQPHPGNKGFVEYERFGLDLRRKDSFPLTDPYVQDYYQQAAAESGVELMGIYLYLMEHQGFMKFADRTPQGEQCRETISAAIRSAAAMKIPCVTVPAKGLFGIAQHTYAFEKLRYAARLGEEYGVKILTAMDMPFAWQQAVLEHLEGRVGVSFSTLDPLLYDLGDGTNMMQTFGKGRLHTLRVKDAAADAEGFLTKETERSALLGEGQGRVAECLDTAQQLGYKGWVVSETPYDSPLIRCDGEDFALAAEKDVVFLKKCLHKTEVL